MASTARHPIVIAKVQCWDNKGVCVLCPFCDEIHYHGFNENYDHDHIRVVHCDYRYPSTRSQAQRYQFGFPFGDYAIDKDSIRFIAGGARLPPRSLNQEAADRLFRDGFQAIVEQKPLWADIGDHILPLESISESEKFDLVVSDMVLGDFKSVRRYLSYTPQARNIFLHGVESWDIPDLEIPGVNEIQDNTPRTSGRTTLHLAACEKYPQIVELLLNEGADVNAPDLDGRTPLMEAALWVRLENVEILLHHGADISLICIHNNHLRCAADFARRLSDNEKTRRARTIYKEDSYQRNSDRREILRLLGVPPALSSAPQLDNFTFSQSRGNPTSLSLTTHYRIPSPWKTVACLIRGGGFPETSAMSGWTHSNADSIQVAGRDWTPEVRRLCATINFTLDPTPIDQGISGQFNACHAEKQLIAYFVHKHLFLSTELIIPEKPAMDVYGTPATLSLDGLSDEALERHRREQAQKEEERIYRTKVVKLSQICPDASVRKADILSSRTVCGNCKSFVDAVNARWGLQLRLLHHCLDAGCCQNTT